jgi:hypothetical protein
MASAFAMSSQSNRFIAVGLTGFRCLGQGGCSLNRSEHPDKFQFGKADVQSRYELAGLQD